MASPSVPSFQDQKHSSPATEQDLKDLVYISRFYGQNPRAVIAGGGNTSMKTEDRIWIKASGHALADIDEEGFAVLDRGRLAKISSARYAEDPFQREREILVDLMDACITKEKRPSVETSLHDLINYKFVVHLHPTLVNGVMCGMEAESHVPKLFGADALYVPYTDPGYILFKEIESRLIRHREHSSKDPVIILLQNHGIFVGAETTAEIREIYDRVFEQLATYAAEMPAAEPMPPVIESGGAEETPPPAIKKGTGPEHGGMLTEILPALRMMLSGGTPKTIRFRNSELVQHFIASRKSFEAISRPFTPDIIVYCKSSYLFIEKQSTAAEWIAALEDGIRDFESAQGYPPKVILLEGWGIIAAGDHAAGADIILDVFEDMMQIAWLSGSFGGPHPMTPEQIQFIDTWEVENYRRKTAAGSGQGQRVLNRTIIVTGAAMGFGAGIAGGLFREGANVVLADINETAGRETLDVLTGKDHGSRQDEASGGKDTSLQGTDPGPAKESRSGKNQAIFVHTDVSDPASLENMVRQTVLAFGGIDAYISNAGILRAGGLDEMDPETFDRVTRINYNAYFYGTRAVSRVMKIQRETWLKRTGQKADTKSGQTGKDSGRQRIPPSGQPFFDIIQINSKSGLSGSRKNFAYAGGKFGGIGLTQSFALELAPWHIKVNAICPGNFFEGPLWSDPENGLFVQYLKAGKVPGAKTVDDVRKHYESQVPMGRGCRVEDVLKAILYVMDQEYETGQAVPVTGGQNMLS